MNGLRKLQQDFAQYLTANAGDVIVYVAEQGSLTRNARLSIYQNAYQIRLRECIETDHPILGRYLGDDLFDKMVVDYIRQYPSRYPSLRQFCTHLPDYLKANKPFRSHPIIAEIAAFERRLLDAFDAADAQPTVPADLQRLPAPDWPAMRLTFHPSVRLLATEWNSVESWRALKQEQAPPTAQRLQGWWLIWRDQERLTQYRNLGVDGLVLYQCFRDGYTLADACELLTEHLAEEQIGPATLNHLQTWFTLGMVAALETEPRQSPAEYQDQ